MITIAIQTHNFQHRLCWMLSSILQQEFFNLHDITVHIAFMAKNGTPSTESVIQYFQSKGLRIKTKTYNQLRHFEQRGIVRNRQLKYCKTPWLLFADSDMVYSRTFFHALYLHLEESQPSARRSVITAGRISQPNDQKDATDCLVESMAYPQVIADPFERCQILPKKQMSNVGAGFFQLVNINECNHGGYYVDPLKCADRRWTEKGQKARSDAQFRRRIGKKYKLPDWFSTHQIHLNHARDKEAGEHLEIQR